MRTKTDYPPVSATIGALLAFAGLALMPLPAVAQANVSSVSEKRLRFDIAAGPVSRALATFSELSGIQLVYPSSLVNGVTTQGLSGEYFPRDALAVLLANTRLEARFTSATTATLTRTGDSARTLGPVRVEGAQQTPVGATAVNGINGSRDPTATEGTGSYTSGALTIGSKTVQSLKDSPQAVSVITARRLEDQNITDFNGAMDRAVGITLIQGSSSLDTNFYARGFQQTAIQIDGGAPLLNRNYAPQIDMSQYDHVELLRGASGTFNLYGLPSGVVNLVRKKPLDHARVGLEAQVGSWQNYRGMIDVTGPLAFAGRIRGRTVFTYQDNEHFYDVAKDNRILVYGILDYDLTPSTLLSAGASLQRQDSVPWVQGLPRYQDGVDLGLSRSTCLCFPWNATDMETTEYFAKMEQTLFRDWTAKINLTKHDRTSDIKYAYSNGTVNPLTGKGPNLSASKSFYDIAQGSAEFTLAGHFNVLGQRQEVVVGANWSKSDGAFTSYENLLLNTAASPYIPYPGAPAGVPAVNLFPFNPNDPFYTEPRDSLRSGQYTDNSIAQYGTYVNLTLTAFDRWHLISGVRFSHYAYNTSYDAYCTRVTSTCSSVGSLEYEPRVVHATSNETSWPPSVSLVYDVTKDLAVSVGYTDIFSSNAEYVDHSGKVIEPITGSNIEVGVKWQSPTGRMFAGLSAYRIEQKNFPLLLDYGPYESTFGYVGPGFTEPKCCYSNGLDSRSLSEGAELELSGEVVRGLELSLGYTWNTSERTGSAVRESSRRQPLVTRAPEHLLKAWASYSVPRGGWLGRVSLGAGVDARSSAFYAGTVCTELNPPNAQGISTCRTSVPYQFTQAAFAVWSGNVQYRMSKAWNLVLNMDNLTDRRYYQTLGTSANGNWYGAPRSLALTLRGTF